MHIKLNLPRFSFNLSQLDEESHIIRSALKTCLCFRLYRRCLQIRPNCSSLWFRQVMILLTKKSLDLNTIGNFQNWRKVCGWAVVDASDALGWDKGAGMLAIFMGQVISTIPATSRWWWWWWRWWWYVKNIWPFCFISYLNYFISHKC